MKVREVAKINNYNLRELELFLESSSFKTKRNVMTDEMSIDDSDVNAIVNAYKNHLSCQIFEEEKRKEEEKREKLAEEEKQVALARILITSGFSFDGYTITKYSGYISGDDAVQVERGSKGFFTDETTNVCDALMASLVTIRRNALAELKEAAYALGCNAVIGVDFDYINLEPQVANRWDKTITEYLPYVFGVTANGNAVIIEKN